MADCDGASMALFSKPAFKRTRLPSGIVPSAEMQMVEESYAPGLVDTLVKNPLPIQALARAILELAKSIR